MAVLLRHICCNANQANAVPFNCAAYILKVSYYVCVECLKLLILLIGGEFVSHWISRGWPLVVGYVAVGFHVTPLVVGLRSSLSKRFSCCNYIHVFGAFSARTRAFVKSVKA